MSEPRSQERNGSDQTSPSRKRRILDRALPISRTCRGYDRATLRADLVSGITVALVLIPQSMAYAQLADLPAHYGLYAALLPPLVSAIFGSSRQLATGPVAVVSLMTSTALAPLATAGSASFIAYAILLATMVGIFQLLLGILRLGMLVNFISHPVVNGFTNAAALIIATSQLSKLFGVDVDKGAHHYETVLRVVGAAWKHTHWPTLLLAVLAFTIMLSLKRWRPRLPNVLVAVVITTSISVLAGYERNVTISIDELADGHHRELIREYNGILEERNVAIEERIAATARLGSTIREHGEASTEAIEVEAGRAKLTVRIDRLRDRAEQLRAGLRELRLARREDSTGNVSFVLRGVDGAAGEDAGGSWRLLLGSQPLDEKAITLIGGGRVVGVIPSGLPAIGAPSFDPGVMLDLLPMAAIISLLGFMEAISIAKAMAARTGHRLDPNQELIGQGLANIAGAFTRSYPVSGSFSRSAVNLQAGAVTGLSSAFSSIVVLLTLLFLTPMLYHLPQSVLAAIIMMAVFGLLNVSGFVHAWRAQKLDGMIAVITFVATLAFAPHLDQGIVLGIVLSLAVFLFRNMRPQIATLSRTPEGTYRSADRWDLDRCRHIAVIRLNSSLFFANVSYIEDRVIDQVASMPEVQHVLIVGNGMNDIDASGEVALSKLVSWLRERGLDVSFTGLNDHVLDVMRRTHLVAKIGVDHFHQTVLHAVRAIHEGGACLEDDSRNCPLIRPRFAAREVAREALPSEADRASWWTSRQAEEQSPAPDDESSTRSPAGQED